MLPLSSSAALKLRVCPDCGKHSIRPSTLDERAAFFRRQIEFAQEHPTR